jgi:hypothetical protein
LQKNISIVIATTGRISLIETINSINSGLTIPKEIIVCSADINTKKYLPTNADNVIFMLTKKKGQVAQRIEGLRKANNLIIVQMDDDVIVEKKTLKELLIILEYKGLKNVIAPVLKNSKTNEIIKKNPKGFFRFIKNLHDFFLIGAKWGNLKMGTISKSGIGFSYDPETTNEPTVQVEWLPGGMVMYYKDNIICEDYYQYQGKAYYEDIIQSILWKKNGAKLILCTNIFAFTKFSKEFTTIKQIFRKRKIRKDIIKNNNGNLFFNNLYFIENLCSYIIKKILNKNE